MRRGCEGQQDHLQPDAHSAGLQRGAFRLLLQVLPLRIIEGSWPVVVLLEYDETLRRRRQGRHTYR
jgi:hypothetical protein